MGLECHTYTFHNRAASERTVCGAHPTGSRRGRARVWSQRSSLISVVAAKPESHGYAARVEG